MGPPSTCNNKGNLPRDPDASKTSRAHFWIGKNQDRRMMDLLCVRSTFFIVLGGKYMRHISLSASAPGSFS